LEKKIATSSASEVPSTSDVPSARFSGTPSSVTAASRAQPTPLARGVLTSDVSIQRGVEGDEDGGCCQEAQP
jgi:hypothetical protein